MTSRLMVIGAQHGSLGEAVFYEAQRAGFNAFSAGIAGEDIRMNLLDRTSVRRAMLDVRPRHIVCTAGVNLPSCVFDDSWIDDIEQSMRVNVLGVLTALEYWCTQNDITISSPPQRHFVAVSSNSAHVARSGSAAYCASKAALSMAIRCVAREQATTNRVIWAAEPGLLRGTPMTQQTMQKFDGPLHRIPGAPPEGLDVGPIARFIVARISNGGKEMNGTCIRLDGGEQ